MILKIVVKIIMVKRNHLKCVDGFGFTIMPLIIFNEIILHITVVYSLLKTQSTKLSDTRQKYFIHIVHHFHKYNQEMRIIDYM